MSSFADPALLADVIAGDIQAKFDSVYGAAMGVRAPARTYGESVVAYECRLLRPLQAHSSSFAKANLLQLHEALSRSNE